MSADTDALRLSTPLWSQASKWSSPWYSSGWCQSKWCLQACSWLPPHIAQLRDGSCNGSTCGCGCCCCDCVSHPVHLFQPGPYIAATPRSPASRQQLCQVSNSGTKYCPLTSWVSSLIVCVDLAHNDVACRVSPFQTIVRCVYLSAIVHVGWTYSSFCTSNMSEFSSQG